MSGTCTYHSQDCNTCPAPATHRVVKGVWERVWHIEEEPASTGGREHFQVPEFCLRHAGEVMEQRNRPSHREATP